MNLKKFGGVLKESFPAETIVGLSDSCQKQKHIDHPPNSHSAKSEQFSYTKAGVAETEPVHTKETKEHRKQNNRRKVVSIVSVWRERGREGEREREREREGGGGLGN